MSQRKIGTRPAKASVVYTRVFEASPDYISISRLSDGLFVDVNPGFERLTGYLANDVLGRSALDLGIWPDPAVREQFVKAVRRGDTQLFQCELGVSNGSLRSVEMAGSIIEINDELVLVAVARDVSERKKAEAELARHREQLEQWVTERTQALQHANAELQQAHAELQRAHDRALESERQSRFQSQHDRLTGLPNRGLLHDRMACLIADAERNNASFATLFIDLDNFKHINDSLCHQAGDDVLRVVSERICNTVRDSDTVARLGGDEFVVVLPNIADRKGVSALAAKILQSLSQPIRAGGVDCQVGGSVGISLFPEDGNTVDRLVQAADSAMYHAKSHGRGTYQFHSLELQVQTQRRFTLDLELRQALAQGQFSLHYQPIVDMRSGQILAAEALLRWQHPARGNIPPLDFIPLAEECGLIVPIGQWVLEEACRQLREWHDTGHSQLRLALNLSPMQVSRIGFADSVAEVLKRFNINGASLDMEITEGVLMETNSQNIHALEQISALGIRLMIDDFGTGYSSLRYLQTFPIRGLKIDRSFVQSMSSGPSGCAITSTVIAMAQHMRLEVIAEGVETEEQSELLRRQGCRVAQGYLHGRPVSASSFTEALTDVNELAEAMALKPHL